MRDWYVHEHGAATRKISSTELRVGLEIGAIPTDALVWSEGMPDWRTAEDVFGLEPQPAAPPPPGMAANGGTFPASAGIASERLVPRPEERSTSPWLAVLAAIIAVGVSFILNSSHDAFLGAFYPHAGHAAAILLFMSAVGATALVGVSSAVALWRNPARRIGSGKAGFLFLLASVAAALEFAHVVSWGIAGPDIYRTAVAVEALEDAEMFVARERVLVFGPIGPNFARDFFDRAAEAAPLRVVEISSPGGLVDQALEVAAYVERTGVRVIVRDHCFSACVLVAVAAQDTWADSDAWFGFHRTSPVAEISSEIMQYGSALIGERSTSFLLAHGIPDFIIERAAQYGQDALYKVAAKEMVGYGAITGTLPDY